jgi:hypothetical protein
VIGSEKADFFAGPDVVKALAAKGFTKATPRLKEFFKGQKLISGSSGWLATAYQRRGNVDALLNYESVLKGIPGLTVISSAIRTRRSSSTSPI